MASAELKNVVEMLRSAPLRELATLDEQRAVMDAFARPVADDVTVDEVDANGVPSEWISAAGHDPGRVILYLHGGGYVLGSRLSHRGLVSQIARAAGGRALSVEYRLGPEHKCPAAIDDAVTAYQWLLQQGIRPGQVVVAGDSAGGGLTLATLLSLRDRGIELPAGGACISPWVDLTGSGESMTTKADVDPMVQLSGLLEMAAYYAGEEPDRPDASPLFAELHGLPPLLIQVGTSETLLDDSIRFAAKAKAAGVDVTLEEWEEMIHVWHFFAGMLPEGQQAIDRIGEFVRQRTAQLVASTA